MSEFKYACPVCGQHIKCDSSQAGTVMDCPTCFQKITVPQAPADADQKFILTGTKVGEKRPPTLAETSAQPTARPAKTVSIAAVGLLVVLALAAGAGVYFFGGKVFHSKWQTADIGNVGVAGTFSENGDTLSIGGSGADIWDKADAFNYAYRSVSGDGVLMVHVVDLQNTDPWAKAGLMFRDSLDPNSAFAEVLVTPKNGVGFQQRTNAGAAAGSVKLQPKLHAPCWLRLTRQGNTFTAESSSDGNKWTAAGSTTIAMKERAYAGLVVCSHKNLELCQATFDHAALTGGSTPGNEAKSGANATPVPVQPAVPKVTAPPANDTNWLLVLGTNELPEAPVMGRIHGQDFLMEHASFGNGSLTLRVGTKGTVELGAVINFEGATAEELTGKTINVTTNAEKAAKVTLRWKDDSGTVQKPAFDSGYALRLQFGLLANNRLPGKIYLCLPDDEKSYLMGSFIANVSKPKPKQEQKPPKQ